MNEQRKMGLISAGEIAESDARHVLMRSLGPEMFVSPDTTALTLQPGDVLVLCTDGVHDETTSTTIAEIVTQQKNMDDIARELVARAVETRWRRQYHGAGDSGALSGAGWHVSRAAVPATLLIGCRSA